MKNIDIPCYYIVGENGEKVAVILDIEDFEALLEGASVFSQLVEATQSAGEEDNKKNKKKNSKNHGEAKKATVKKTTKKVASKTAGTKKKSTSKK